ncbi:MAG TPA: hypothetical protein VKX31_00420 [Brumimicrobium sp.]|nr:hypothetical protein [Brumimicrobium sp.]
MDGPIFINFIYPTVTVFITAFVTWFFARRKNAAEVTGIDIDNAREIIKLYKEATFQLKDDAQAMRKLLEEHQKIINKYRTKCIQPDICKE